MPSTKSKHLFPYNIIMTNMKKTFVSCLLIFSYILSFGQSKNDFITPPDKFCNHVIWGWDGIMSKKIINSDLNSIQAKGFRNVIIEPGYHMPSAYLSKGWFEAVKDAINEAKRRKMKVWIIDEGKYPSGFAGGKFSQEKPELGMQTLVHDGDTVKAIYRTSPTRNVNNPTGKKDESASLCDYLNKKAVHQFIEWTHQQYQLHIGSEFGKTVLGFRGDEPDYNFFPFTPSIIDTFSINKGYDIRPYLADIIDSKATLTTKLQQIKADYWDVWSQMFTVNYFGQIAQWCHDNHLEYIVHLNKDDNMNDCVRTEGDMFRDLGIVQIPGIDVIWNQIWPGKENDFPKFVSSIAHIHNRQRAFSESFAAFNPEPTIKEAKFILDYQITRGINFFEFMFWPSKHGPVEWMKDKKMKDLVNYTDRTTWMMSQGKPSARIAVYYPIPALWMGDKQTADNVKALSLHLLSTQHDFDYINDENISDTMRYETLMIPSCDIITKKAWDNIKTFRQKGGKVIFSNKRPTQLVDKTFTEPIPLIIDFDSDSLPKSDLYIVDGPRDSIRYTHRTTEKSEIYFLFNESKNNTTLTLDLDAIGKVECWDASNGKITDVPFTVKNNATRIQLHLKGWDSKMIVITKSNRVYNITQYTSIQKAIDTAHDNGGGTVVVPKGDFTTGALFFKRGVDLRIDGRLISAVDTSLFPIIPSRYEGREQMCRSALLNFTDCPKVHIYGSGTIDGKGLIWKTMPRDHYSRPKLICFTRCNGGIIEGIKMRNQAFWCLHVLYTDDFNIRNVDIAATDYIPSSDGIDIDSSTGIHVMGARITAHDDCISIKSGKDEDGRRVARPSENILIDSCIFNYGHGGVAIGSEVSGNIRNVTVRDCIIKGENWNPLRIKSQPSRGGIIEDITYENIVITKARNVFEINMEWRMVPPLSPAYFPLTTLRNIHFRNIKAHAENAGIITGFKDCPIKRDAISFENVNINVNTPLKISNADIDTTGLNVSIKE